MEEFRGLTAEMYRAIVAVVDDRLKEIRVAREDFQQLSQTVAQLAQAQARTEQRLEELAQAQARTEQRLEQLAQAQVRTDERLGRLEAAQEQTQQALRQLAEAQARTEQALQQLVIQVGALSENVGYGLEDIARVVLPGYLKHRYGIELERLECRIFRVDGQVIEVDLYGEGKQERRRVVVLGEVKSRIYAREVSQFQKNIEAVQAQLPAEPVPLMFGYFIDLSALEAAQERMLLIASYQPVVELSPPSPRRKGGH